MHGTHRHPQVVYTPDNAGSTARNRTKKNGQKKKKKKLPPRPQSLSFDLRQEPAGRAGIALAAVVEIGT